MKEQQNVELIKRLYKCFETRNIPALLAPMADDILWIYPEIENVAHSGQRQGRQQVVEFFKTLMEEQEINFFEPREFIARGDKVIVLGYYKGTVRATGAEYETYWVQVFGIKEGKITMFQEYADTAAISAAFNPSEVKLAGNI
jgi:ketosteroid isomerase-like protein